MGRGIQTNRNCIVISSLFYLVTSSEFWLNFGYTIGRVLLGFGLSLFLGAVFGILAGLSHKAYEIIKPMVVIIESVPPIIWIIFAILWFGLGNLPVIFAIMSIVTQIIILNLSHGIQDIDPLLLEMTRSFSIKKRTSIARALAIEPDLILMDEPFSDLDFPLRLLLIDHLKAIFQIKNEPLILELPSYRKPLAKNVFVKGWIRMKDFVYIVIPLLALGGIAYGILKILNITGTIVEPLSPITLWLGLPPVMIIPLVFGFLQKDLTGAMLISVLGSKISLVLTPIQIYTFGIASTIGVPCIIALGMLVKEFGCKKATILTMISILYGILWAGFIERLMKLFP
jgi:MFS family permease